MKKVCVYCGSSSGSGDGYLEMADRLGRALARRKLDLVYGGARVGLMGRVADAVLAEGGDVIGVIPGSFPPRVAHPGLTELRVVGTMHERKNMMFAISDAFIALPGGLGTLEEILEVLTWAQLGIHGKPCGLVNVQGYFDTFLSFLDHAVSNGFLKREHRSMLLVEPSPEGLLRRMDAFCRTEAPKWAEMD
jgi:uncharacterized protein (TIGR00730 family)